MRFYAYNARTGLYWDGRAFAVHQVRLHAAKSVDGPELAVLRATYDNTLSIPIPVESTQEERDCAAKLFLAAALQPAAA